MPALVSSFLKARFYVCLISFDLPDTGETTVLEAGGWFFLPSSVSVGHRMPLGTFRAVSECIPMKESFSMAFLQFTWCLSVTAHLQREMEGPFALSLCLSLADAFVVSKHRELFPNCSCFLCLELSAPPLLPPPPAPRPNSLAQAFRIPQTSPEFYFLLGSLLWPL